jgi:hypothetical protein
MQSSGFSKEVPSTDALSSQDVSLSSVTTETDFLGRSTDDRSMVQVATRHLSVRSVEDLSLYEEHSAIIQRLCRELGFEKPATAMAWVFDQLEQSKDLQKAIFDLLND